MSRELVFPTPHIAENAPHGTCKSTRTAQKVPNLALPSRIVAKSSKSLSQHVLQLHKPRCTLHGDQELSVMSDEAQTGTEATHVGPAIASDARAAHESNSVAHAHDPTGPLPFVAPLSYLRPLSRAQPHAPESGTGSRPTTSDSSRGMSALDKEQIEGLVGSAFLAEVHPSGLRRRGIADCGLTFGLGVM